MTKRVTFHNTNPGPITLALVDQHAGSACTVQQQHFIHKVNIAKIVDDEWVFLGDRLMVKLLQLKPIFEEAWNWREPQWNTLMLDSEPINTLYGSSRTRVMQDALGMARNVLGATVQTGFYSNPSHKGLGNKRLPDHYLDDILAKQGAIFVTCNFSNRGNKWFEKGMRQAQALIGRLFYERGDRPTVGYVYPRRWPVAGFDLIPDDKLLEHLHLLNNNNVEIVVANLGNDAEGAHLIELARSVVLEE